MHPTGDSCVAPPALRCKPGPHHVYERSCATVHRRGATTQCCTVHATGRDTFDKVQYGRNLNPPYCSFSRCAAAPLLQPQPSPYQGATVASSTSPWDDQTVPNERTIDTQSADKEGRRDRWNLTSMKLFSLHHRLTAGNPAHTTSMGGCVPLHGTENAKTRAVCCLGRRGEFIV